MDLDSIRRMHGGYWRYPYVDFHYLFNQYFPPAALYAELQDALLRLANSYPSSQQGLAELLARWNDDHAFVAGNLVVGNGSSELIKLLMDRVISTVTVPLPTFNEFTVGPTGRVHHYALDESAGFALDVERLLDEVRRSGSDYAVIVNPHNPVGYVVPRDQVRRILETGVRLVVDEAFMAFSDPGYSAEPLVEEFDNLIIVSSATKSVGIAGLRLGYVLTTNHEVREQLRAGLPIWNVNALAEYILEAFPRYRAEHRASLERIKSDTRWFQAALEGVSYLEPFPTQTNAVFCRVHGSGRKLAELLFDRHGFVIKDGLRQAGLVSRGSYVRIGVRNRSDNGALLDALHVIAPDQIQDACAVR